MPIACQIVSQVNSPMTDQPENPPDERTLEFLRRLRDRIESDPKLTPTSLALMAGLDNSAIRSFLSGRAKSPKLSTVNRIMAALGTTYEEFMGNPKTPEERDILRLVAELPVTERLQLLGFAKALRGAEGTTRQPGNGGSQ